MGNEMGNNNTSGFQEEENSTTQVQQKPVLESEVKDYLENDNAVATDVLNGASDPHVANQTSNAKEEKETRSFAESPKIEVKSNSTEASDEISEMKPNHIFDDDSKVQEKPHGNTDGEGENHIVSIVEGKDFYEKEINGLPFGVLKEAEDSHMVNHISDEREQETEVLAPAESPKFEVTTDNEAGSEISDSKPTSPSNCSKYQDMQQESNLTKNLPRIIDHQLEKQTSIRKVAEGTEHSTCETINSSDDLEPQESEDSKIDQSELDKTHADPPVQDSNGSPHSHEDILGSNLNCSSVENGDLIDTKIFEDMDETVVTGSDLEVERVYDDLTVKERVTEEVCYEDLLAIKDEGENGNGLGGNSKIKSVFLDGEGIKCDGAAILNTDSPKAESEENFMDEKGISEFAYKCEFPAAETTLAEKESERVEKKPDDYLTRSHEESVKESKTDTANFSRHELLIFESEGENKEKRIADFTCFADDKACTVEASQNEAALEHSKDSQEVAEMVPESRIVSTESSLTVCERVEVPQERQIIEEILDRTRASYGDQCMSPVEQEELSLLKAPLSLFQPQGNQLNHSIGSTKIKGSNDSASEFKRESNGDFLVTEASCFDVKNLMVETSVSVAESAIKKPEQDLQWAMENTIMVAAVTNTQVNNVSEQCEGVEMPAIASEDYQLVHENVGRLSTESNSNNLIPQVQMQKSPSFSLDLRIEARTEESDRTPLLWQDKTAFEDFSGEQEVSLSPPIAHTHYDQDKLQSQTMPVEERVVRMERSDSEKSKTPFLGFLKEDEEPHSIVTPQKHENINAAEKKTNKESFNLDTKEVAATSKEKRKPITSLFTTCICCTTVIN